MTTGSRAARRSKVKEREVYPRLIEQTVKFFCVDEGKSSGYELENLVKFIIKELDVHPRLAGELYAALGEQKIVHREHLFLQLARAARDSAALPHLARISSAYDWGEAVLALLATDFAETITTTLKERASYHDDWLPVAAGFLLGAAARDQLLELFAGEGSSKDAYALGLAFIANPEDAPLFKQLSTADQGGNAKRVFKVLTSTKRAERLKGLDQLSKGRRHSLMGLLLFCRLLEDPDAQVVARCASHLATYATQAGEHPNNAYHQAFLHHAARAVL
ncbi:MAG: hypothetical protein JRH20_16210, partial [Deltaproteobacteria bacterium]|nr:hypothetical protein [Deltaproteobacteria bacterium]